MYTLPSSIIPFHIIIFLSLCQPRSILSLLVRLHALQAPKNDDAFWNAERCRGMEPSSTVFEQQHDVVNTQYVGNWHYNYRSRGMKTSTDDVIVAYMACASTSSSKDNISRYVDFGCGIGSTLLLVNYNLCPLESIGMEAQEQSFQLLQETIRTLPDTNTLKVIHVDLRKDGILEPLSVQLITANPPYAPLSSGTLCKDEQRRGARFEMRGGVEEYCNAAKRLLTKDGRFILSFWQQNHGDRRVRKAASNAGLKVFRTIDVYMGDASESVPHITVYELIHSAKSDEIHSSRCNVNNIEPEWLEPFSTVNPVTVDENGEELHELKFILNITKTHGQGYSSNYESIRKKLNMT